MALLRLEPFPTFSRSLEKNKWADFLELLCLESPDKEISLNDIMTMYTQEELSGISNGDESHSQKVDNIRSDFSEIFRYIFSRINYMDDFYPFIKIDEDTIKMSNIDEKKLLYFFLLFASNTGYITNTAIPPFLRISFERISIDIMRLLYPNFRNELFGTSTQDGEYFHGGLLIDKLDRLGKCLNTSLKAKARNDPHSQFPSGDGGIDLVSFKKIDKDICSSFMIPVCIGQCSSSYGDWQDKQLSVKADTLNNLFDDIAVYHEYMFISFPLRGINGKWASEEAVKIQTILIDRIRFLNILDMAKKATILNSDISNRMKEIMDEFDVSY
jgi:hypothetical protein